MMVERLVPLYQEALSALNRPMAGLEPEAKGAAAAAKMAAGDFIASVEPVLFPGDEDG